MNTDCIVICTLDLNTRAFTVCLHMILVHTFYIKMVKYVRKEAISQSNGLKFCLTSSGVDK